MNVYLGIDGGSSKTAAALVNEHRKVIWESVYPPLSPIRLNEIAVSELVSDILKDARSALTDGDVIQALGIGAAGLSLKGVNRLIVRAVRTVFDGEVFVAQDHEIALWGALGSADIEGAILIAGAGAMAYGQNAKGERFLSGGAGYLIGDEGGGHWLGTEVLRAVVRALDGRGPDTALRPWLEETLRDKEPELPPETKFSVSDIYRFTYDANTTLSDIAAISVGLIEASGDDDAVSILILERAADELATLAGAVIDKLGLDHSTLVLAGSWLSRDLILRRPLLDRLESRYPELKTVLPQADAATGAALLAMHRSEH